jgi:phage terminase large subunit
LQKPLYIRLLTLPKEKIAQLMAWPGPDHPHTRSVLYGEFMDQDDDSVAIFSEADIRSNQEARIQETYGQIVCGCDFALGGDQNAIIKRCGNFVPAGGIQAWREKNSVMAAAQFVNQFVRMDLKESEIWGDSGGVGSDLIDQILGMRWRIGRLNNCERSPDPRYKNYGAYLWHETAKKVRMHEIKVPKDDDLIKQLLSRRIKFDTAGKLWLEDKKDMKARGAPSPDIADAFCIAFGHQSTVSRSCLPGDQESTWAEISERQGWAYSGQDERDLSH